MTSKRIAIPIYRGFLYIITYDDVKELQRKFDWQDQEACEALVWREYHDNAATRYYVAFQKATPENISHEVVHLVNYIFEDRGIKPDLVNDEPQAYLHGYLFKVIYAELKKLGKIEY